jgi:hypothetical protein
LRFGSLGRGVYGEVWLARNIMGTVRAVKVIWPKQFESDRRYARRGTVGQRVIEAREALWSMKNGPRFRSGAEWRTEKLIWFIAQPSERQSLEGDYIIGRKLYFPTQAFRTMILEKERQFYGSN